MVSPTATRRAPDPVTALSIVPEVVLAAWLVQATPSVEVRIAGFPLLPKPPTATNLEPDHTTALSVSLVIRPVDRDVQLFPSDEVKATPPAPTTTSSVPDDATPCSSAEVPDV